LIAGILCDELDDFVNEAISSGREPLVEVHNSDELENALATRANMIGINNRNLTTMKVTSQQQKTWRLLSVTG